MILVSDNIIPLFKIYSSEDNTFLDRYNCESSSTLMLAPTSLSNIEFSINTSLLFKSIIYSLLLINSEFNMYKSDFSTTMVFAPLLINLESVMLISFPFMFNALPLMPAKLSVNVELIIFSFCICL